MANIEKKPRIQRTNLKKLMERPEVSDGEEELAGMGEGILCDMGVFIYEHRWQIKGISGGPCPYFFVLSTGNLDKWNQENVKETKEIKKIPATIPKDTLNFE